MKIVVRRILSCGAGVLIAAILGDPSHGGSARPNKDISYGVSVSAEDYRRAEQWLSRNVFPKVKNIFVKPNWIGQSDRFWYRRETSGGHDFMVVDAGTGEKRAAFDHDLMALRLEEATGEKADKNALPIDALTYSDRGDTLKVTSTNRTIVCAIDLAQCTAETQPDPMPGVLVSPDGKWGALSRGGNLYVKDMATGAETAMTTDGSSHHGYGIYYGNWKADYIPRVRSGEPLKPMASEWSPDSSKFLVTRLDERHVAEYPMVVTVPSDGSFRPKLYTPRIPLTGEEPAKLDWHVIDVKTGRKVRLELPYDDLLHVHQDMLAVRETWWSEASDRLYLVAFGDLMQGAYLFEADLATGSVRTVIEERIAPRTDLNSTSYNPPNVQVIGDGDEIIWFSQRDGWGHLYLYDGKTGALNNQITSGDWLVRDIVHVDEARRQVYFTGSGREAGDPYFRYLYRANFNGDDLTLLTPETADHLLAGRGTDIISLDGAIGYEAVSPSGNYVVYNYSRIDMPTKSAIRRTGDGGLISIFEEADASALYAEGWQDPEPFVAKAADGETDVYGVIYKPRNLDPAQKYPVIDSQYASPLTAVAPHNFQSALTGVVAQVRPASLAELGFVSVVVDARGTTYRSREFSHYSYRNLNRIGLDDHIAALRELAASRPWMDLERVGIHGVSYGGYTTFRAMFEFPDFFKVGVSNAGMGSVTSMYPDYHWEAFHEPVVYSDGSRRRSRPDEEPVSYQNNNSTSQAENLEGELLIMLGERDENVFPATTLQIVNRLIELDKDFEIVLFPDKPHSFGNPHSIRRSWDFLVRHLHKVEPPDYRITPADTSDAS